MKRVNAVQVVVLITLSLACLLSLAVSIYSIVYAPSGSWYKRDVIAFEIIFLAIGRLTLYCFKSFLITSKQKI
jgi:hypothetical protein